MTAKKTTYVRPGQPTMMLYANQAAVTITKDNYAEEGIMYLQVGVDEWMEAKRNLTDSAFTLYLYLSSNMNGIQKALSPADVCVRTGIGRRSYYNAKNELISKGYMIEQKKDNKTMFYDNYTFYTNPKLNKEWCVEPNVDS